MEPAAFASDLAVKAGELLLKLRQDTFTVESKGGNPRDIVTSIDREVNEYIIGAIKQSFPGQRIFSEEGGDVAEGGDEEWVVDPIDGSSNFSRGIPHYAVCIGLLQKGVPTAGAVYNPATRELFSFAKGKGTFLNGAPVHVSNVSELKNAQVVCSPGSRKPELWDWAATSYRKLLEHTLKRGMYGSSALDICFIAAGRADAGVYGTLNTKDIAGALGVLYEAGGAACNVSGQPVTLSSESQKVFMGNSPAMAERMRVLLES